MFWLSRRASSWPPIVRFTTFRSAGHALCMASGLTPADQRLCLPTAVVCLAAHEFFSFSPGAGMRQVAVIDFETTGLRAGIDRIIEVGAVVMCDGEVTATFSELMDPGFRIPAFITGLTGISDTMVRGKPRPEAVMPRLRAFLGDHPCIAHNASFDQRFFTAEMALSGQQHERRFLCSMLLARRLVQQAPSHKLGALVQHLRLTTPPGLHAHRALDDVLMTCALWQHLINDLRTRLNGLIPDHDLLRTLSAKPKTLVASYLAGVAHRAVQVQSA